MACTANNGTPAIQLSFIVYQPQRLQLTKKPPWTCGAGSDPLDGLINPETLGSWNTENCALFQSSVDNLDMFSHVVDFPMPSQSSTSASHDLGGGSLEGRQQRLVQSSDNGPISQEFQSLPTPLPQLNTSTPSPNSSGSTSSKPKPSRIEKRESNTLAARRYRQRRVDQVKNLEAELEKTKQERDELRIRVSKLEGETEALRSLVRK
ncbi:bZIP transcription factor JlbA/IDI-4 [Aspergillus ruber CBS 135680]|uniref:BZIP domain-containing protein n=1 Tax=Aspergillus ruber (strain CBS 135680) TaxID=1388766 RepID=A0A017SMA0_ASPRC|nr:uncharacterized protein EURHEDRAFT_375587 [Aspergillus ruber CBS 135680]EYE97769.1 hypothetical protein EURHEDRAFT_375587 [Aspergillus ruber CBS 135680]